MKRFLLSCSIILLLLQAGCSSIHSVTVANDVKPGCPLLLTVRPGENENTYSGLTRYETQRFFCTEGSTHIHSEILETAAAEAVKGNLFGAGIIFMELKDKEKNGSVENNLAIIYELNGNNSEAFTMYSTALLLNPDNTLFRKNLYCFILDKGIRLQPKIEKKRKLTDAQR